ncbi:MAG TPA: hypothetical protein VFW87_02945, partial [Pirellulales bacterium]|nr:hypothetical protein [Pirellulales bacterium]
LVGEECWARLALARRMALEGRWEAGRAEFTRVRALDHEFARGFRVAARQAVFELKAGDAQRAGAFIEEAQALAPDPTGLWLALSIEATRYALPAARRREFQQEFQAALKKKTSGKAAALLAEILVAYLGAEVEYEGRDDHVEAVVSYIERSSRAKYSEAELLAACWFLQGLPAARDLFERFVRRGRKAFPESPEFLCLAAEVEMAKGPMRANLRQLRKLLDQASQRIDAMASDDPKRVASLKSHVLRMDDMVRAAADVRENLPDFSTDMLDELLRFLPDDLEMFGDDDDSDDDGFGFSSAPGARLPRPRG